MSLADKLKNAMDESGQKFCKIGMLFIDPKLSTKDKDHLITILNTPEDDPTRVPNTTLGKILREEGYDISNSAVDRHRSGNCACKRMAK
jgi:hypothetical protein